MKKGILRLLIVALSFFTIGCSSMNNTITLKPGDALISPEIKGIKNNIDQMDENKSHVELIGSTAGNLDNFGYYAYKDGWVYYGLDQLRNGKGLYKKRIDDEKAIKLSDNSIRYINLVGDWIYYISFKEGIYRIKTDGTEETLLCEDKNIKNIYVYGDWIMCHSDELYKLKTDGSKKIVVSNKKIFKIMPDKNKLYFMTFEVENGARKVIYEIDWQKTPSRTKKLLEIDMKTLVIPTADTIIQDGWIYYIDYKTENGRIAKIKVDGTEKIILTDQPATNLNIKDGWIYYLEAKEEPKIEDKKNRMSYEPYMDLKYKIHKIRIDGKQKTLLLDKELDFWRKIYLIQDRILLMELKNEEIISLKEEKANG